VVLVDARSGERTCSGIATRARDRSGRRVERRRHLGRVLIVDCHEAAAAARPRDSRARPASPRSSTSRKSAGDCGAAAAHRRDHRGAGVSRRLSPGTRISARRWPRSAASSRRRWSASHSAKRAVWRGATDAKSGRPRSRSIAWTAPAPATRFAGLRRRLPARTQRGRRGRAGLRERDGGAELPGAGRARRTPDGAEVDHLMAAQQHM
jgi:hypothetical protein